MVKKNLDTAVPYTAAAPPKNLKEGQLVEYSNGAQARIGPNGKPGRIEHGAPNFPSVDRSAATRARVARRLEPLDKRGEKASLTRAKKEWHKYFKQKAKTMSPRGLKAAKTADMCREAKHVVTDRRYLRNPQDRDFKGWDDGTNCGRYAGKGAVVRKHTPKELSPAEKRMMKEKMARVRAAKGGARGRKKSPRGLDAGCGFNATTNRCQTVESAAAAGVRLQEGKFCASHVSKKTGKKTCHVVAGEKPEHLKKVENVARGKSIRKTKKMEPVKKMDPVLLQTQLAQKKDCTQWETEEDCEARGKGLAANCTWTEAHVRHTRDGKELNVPAKCGKHRGKVSADYGRH